MDNFDPAGNRNVPTGVGSLRRDRAGERALTLASDPSTRLTWRRALRQAPASNDFHFSERASVRTGAGVLSA